VFILILDKQLVWYDEKNYHSIAVNLANGDGFVSSFNPFSTTSWAPLLSYFIAFFYWIFGPHVFVVRLVQAILGTVICWIMYLIGKELADEKVGLLSAAIMAFHPIFIYTVSALYPIILFTLLISIIVLLLIKFLSQNKTIIWLALIGLLIGLAMLTRPVIIFFIPFIPLWFLFSKKVSFLRTVRNSALIFLVAGLTIMPWTLRNYFKYEKLYFITEEGANSFFTTNIPSYDIDRSKNQENQAELRNKAAELSPQNEDKYISKQAFDFIFKSPGEFAKLYFKKFINFWRFYPKTISQNKFTSQKNNIISLLFYGFVIPVAFLGMFVSLKQWRKLFVLFAIIFSFNIGYSFFMTSIRYRLPVEPYIIIFSAMGMLIIFNKIYETLLKRQNQSQGANSY